MKKILAAALALSLFGGSAALAQPFGGDHHGPGDNRRDMGRHDQPQHRTWSRGQRLPQAYRGSSHAVDYRRHKLRAPPRGYRWQQVDNNYVLAAIATGLISQVVNGR